MSKTTRATQALARLGVNFVLHIYDYDPGADRIGLQAAEALGIEPQRMLKTLMAEVDGKPVTVPHENVAVGMALGYYLITGKPQLVMVHVNVGTANAICGVMNAWRGNVPILFSAGRTPYSEEGGLMVPQP